MSAHGWGMGEVKDIALKIILITKASYLVDSGAATPGKRSTLLLEHSVIHDITREGSPPRMSGCHGKHLPWLNMAVKRR